MTPKSFMSVNSLFRASLSPVIARAASSPTCHTNIRVHLLLYCSESWDPSVKLCSHVPEQSANIVTSQLILRTCLCKTLRNAVVILLHWKLFIPLFSPSSLSFINLSTVMETFILIFFQLSSLKCHLYKDKY